MLMFGLATLVLATLLAIATAIDIRTQRIPDIINASIVASGLAATLALERALADALMGAAIGYLALAAVKWGFRRVRGYEGIGLGDAKLLAGAGAWLGWAPLPFVVLIGAALGLAFVAVDRLRGGDASPTRRIAFGPFLAAATLAAWLATAWIN